VSVFNSILITDAELMGYEPIILLSRLNIDLIVRQGLVFDPQFGLFTPELPST
jgi:hypothetical protein